MENKDKWNTIIPVALAYVSSIIILWATISLSSPAVAQGNPYNEYHNQLLREQNNILQHISTTLDKIERKMK